MRHGFLLFAYSTIWLLAGSLCALVEEIDKISLISALHHWQSDLGVMFYAPWCQYCKQFSPYWQEIADHLQSRETLQLRRFNCEQPLNDYSELCRDFGVDSYPSLYFIGYGNFYQSGSFKENLVKYKADIYPDAILIWLRMLNTISSCQQKWDNLRSLLPFSSHRTLLAQQHSTLVDEAKDLRQRLQSYVQTEEREKAWKIMDQGVDRGDVFPLLNAIDPTDKKSSPLRMCVSDYALEFCRNDVTLEEEFCGIIADCVQENLKPEMCRPPTCPFRNRLGCKLLSNCLDPDVIELFKAAAEAQTTGE